MIKRFTSLFMALMSVGAAFAGIPAGYYSKAENKSGASLLSALESCISSHTTLSYGSLFGYYSTTDCYPGENKIWDIYSTKHWPVGEKCGNYSSIGDCYNKEHSVPKSWFNDASPMYSDLMHLYPTDGYVNGQRSNYPYGVCAGGSYVASKNGVQALGRLGKSTYSGYTGTVFEPDDEYKGDLARTYFYMAACYNSRVSAWKTDGNFGGTSYPVFNSWTQKMLMEWHRMDPVSQKEIDRNEAVYGLQGNRNPFVDYPDLAEHIWGNRTTEKWSSAATAPATLNAPADGSSIDLGITTAGVAVSYKINLMGTKLTKALDITATAPFSCSNSTVSASDANSGLTLTITFNPSENKEYTGTLTISSSEVKSTVKLSGKSVAGLPVGAATNISSDSFTANWTYIGGDTNGKYTLEVSDSEGLLSGYPLAVDARAGSYQVRDLQPSTAYSYTVNAGAIKGNIVEVTTAEALPFIDFLFDGDLFFQGEPGAPTPAAEIIMAVENIDTEITLTIDYPFELSVDKSQWGTTLKLSPDESRFYLRMNAAEDGEYESQLEATTDGYQADNTTIRGYASSGSSFLEDFENGKGMNNYCDFFEGSAATWVIKNGGFWNGDVPISGDASLRFVKGNEAFVAMAEDRKNGIGTVSFLAQKWNNTKDKQVEVDIETSTDGGLTWTKHGSVTISKTTAEPFTVYCGVPGNARLRINKTAGDRWFIDDIAISDLTTGLAEPDAIRHQWDAYGINGELVVEMNAAAAAPTISIYCIDGSTVFSGSLENGIHRFEAARGQFYIVADGEFSRTVLVR